MSEELEGLPELPSGSRDGINHDATAPLAGWQPIATAPKDGYPVDLWGHWPEGNDWQRTADAKWTGVCWQLGQHTEHQFKYPPTFTHWMRVEPPAA